MLPHLLRDVLPHDDVRIAEVDGTPLGVLVLERNDAVSTDLPLPGRDVLGQLSVAPQGQGRGVGSRLIEEAKVLRPEGLDLWVSNTRARAFYRSRGFEVVGGTSGRNEDRAPTCCCAGARAASSRFPIQESRPQLRTIRPDPPESVQVFLN